MADNLPTGFTVDQPANGLPSGFTVDQQTPPVSGLRAGLEGLKAGASAGWSDEITGLMAAAGAAEARGYLPPEQQADYEKQISDSGGLTGIYHSARDDAKAQRESAQTAHPYYYGAGELGGAGATMAALPIGGVGAGAGWLARAGQGARLGATYGALRGAATGTQDDGLPGAIVGTGMGAAEGALGGFGGEVLAGGAGVLGRLGYDAFGRPLVSAVRGYLNPLAEAARKVAGAWASDIPQALAGTGRGLTPSQYVQALRNGEPVLPTDMGETSRALMRWAANADSEARAIITDAVGQRYAQQSERGGALIRDLVSGGANTAKTAAQLEAEYDAERGGAYGVAYAAGDRPIWSPELERLSSSPTVAGAIRGAQNRWKDFQVKDGFGAMNPPVNVTPDGQLKFLPGRGLMPYPNIQFWDYAARNLAGMASQAKRAGNNTDAGLYGGLEQQLKAELDKLVPEFGDARGIAAKYFGGNNAIEAGQNALNFKGDIRELQRTMAQMKPAEREMFQESYADAMARKVENMSDNQSIVNRVYNSPQERARVEAILGPQAADRLGAFVDRERIFDAARTALGNSTTVRQMIEMGLAGSLSGAAGSYLTGDWRNFAPAAIAGASARAGFRSLVGYVDRNTARNVAQLLTSSDPAQIMRGIQAVRANPKLSSALRETGSIASGMARNVGAAGAIGRLPRPQLPAPAAAAEPNQPNVPGVGNQQNRGGAVHRQERARGGQVKPRRAKDGHLYLKDPARPGKFLRVIPRG